MPAAHELPSELHDKIIDIVDFKTANRCALVSRAWQQRARSLWWSRPLLIRLWAPEVVQQTEKLMKLITHPHCTFAHFLVGLCIQGPDERFRSLEYEAALYVKLNQFIHQLSKLPAQFQYLSFDKFTIDRIHPSNVVVLNSFRDVTLIRFGGVEFPSNPELCKFIANFPLLDAFDAEFRNHRPPWSQPGLKPKKYDPSPLSFRSLRHLSLKVSVDFDDFVAALRCHACPVEEISLRDFTIETLGLASPLLEHVGAALKALTLQPMQASGLFSRTWSNEAPTPLLLDGNINLESLAIHPIGVQESHLYPMWWLTLFLVSITSPNFSNLELVFEMDGCSSYCFEQFNWSELDDLGLIERHALFEHISIDVRAGMRFFSDDIVDLAFAARSRLPKLVATGKLNVTQSASDNGIRVM